MYTEVSSCKISHVSNITVSNLPTSYRTIHSLLRSIQLRLPTKTQLYRKAQNNQEALSEGHKGNYKNKVNTWTSVWLHQMTSLPCFSLNICQNSILKSKEIQLPTGACCTLLICEYCNTYFSNVILKLSVLCSAHPHTYMPQDTHSTVISTVLSLMPQWVLPVLGDVKNPKQNASVVSAFGVE